MATISLQKEKIEHMKGVVVLPILEYKKLLEQATPAYHLTGMEAKKIDKLVIEGIKEFKSGKTKKIRSLADLD